MAFAASTPHAVAGHASLGARIYEALVTFFVRYAEVRSRSRQIEALNRLSDTELAARGLTRDGIVRHVFSDCYYL